MSFLVVGAPARTAGKDTMNGTKDYKPFRRKRIKYVSADEMKHILKTVKEAFFISYGPKPSDIPFSSEIAWIEDNMVELRVTVKIKEPCTYVLRKDNSEAKQKVDGMTTYGTLNKYYKVPDFSKDGYVKQMLQYDEGLKKFSVTSKALLYCNPKYDGKQRINGCYGYDLNSSYPNAMLKQMPDTSEPYRTDSIVKDGEIGLITHIEIRGDESVETTLKPVFRGFAEFVFPLMESPFKRFVEVWYGKKKNAKCKDDKEKAKQMLNYAIGYLQKHNPFLRATIIYYANLAIEEKMDEDTLLCSTDSLVSKRKRDDLVIGKEIGQFKLEHEGDFYYRGMNYQWNLELPTYRGIPKTWFKSGWDLSKDPLPKCGNVYGFDKETLKLTENIL